jgi:stage II sporulation protein D
VELGLEEYLVGVVAAEMSVSFPLEALKAQAVAARTYAVKRLQIPDPRIKNMDLRADLTSDSTINQAWISSAQMQERWGKQHYLGRKNIITQAVLETRGEVLIYEGQLIDPVYFSSCGGRGTEDSGNVWKYDIPYLQAVPCSGHPNGNKEAVHVFKISEVNTLVGSKLAALPSGKSSAQPAGVKTLEKSEAGRIKSLQFGGKTLSGEELRSRIGLPSTIFSMEVVGGNIKFSSVGYGHGVGMCQYGAAARAEEGKNYLEILKYYYQGVELATVKSRPQ